MERAFHQVSGNKECALHLNALEADDKLVLLEMGRQKTAEEKSYVRAQTVWFQLHLRVLDQRRICQKKDSETGGRGGGDLSVTSENGNSNMIIQMCNKLK